MALRPTTNLVIPQHLMLPKKALKEKFLYVYTKAYTGSPTSFMTKLWASVIFPSITNDPKFGKVAPRKVADQLAKVTPAGYLQVRKVMDAHNPHFVASIPLYSFGRHNTGAVTMFLRDWFLGENQAKKPTSPTAETLQESRDFVEKLSDVPRDRISDQVLPLQKVIEGMRLDALGTHALKESLLAVRIQTKGNVALIFADFKITKEEAQQLTTTEWQELRDIDLYPLLLHWVVSGWGVRAQAPIAAFPISKIAFSLPPSHSESARVNDLSLSIGPNGHPYYLPKVVDKQQTIAYEDRYLAAGAREDGTFSLHNINEGAAAMESGREVKNKLPANMVVAVDWLNNKFSYTNTEGFLTVMDLTRFQPADVSHIRTLLEERVISDKEVTWFLNMGAVGGVPSSVFEVVESDYEDIDSPYMKKAFENAAGSKNVVAWFSAASVSYQSVHKGRRPTYSDISIRGFSMFRPLARLFKKIEAGIRDNLEAVYLKYSVSTVMQMLPWLMLVAHYTDDIQDLKAKDATNRKAALEQGVDPNWKMPSVPMLSDNIGLLPHQVKVRNLLKDSPDFAIMPIQAGGGKSPLLLIDILLEIKANRSEPYLVICPGHLVANYVNEVVYFTSGKMNVIAITNWAVRQNGWKRLQQMLEHAPRNTVVVVAFDTLRFRPRTVSYGTTPVTVFPVIDFLRQFKFGYLAIDEAHKIKGETARNKAVMALIADIPKKRLASGTMVHDSPSDLAMQIAALDPTLFGTKEEFNERYGDVVRGGRVIKWKDGAQREIMRKIKSRIVVAGAMRKEWAALLPKKVEWIGGVNLTPSQQAVYEDILNETIQRIEEDAKTHKELQKLVRRQHGLKDEVTDGEAEEGATEDGEKVVDEDEGEDLAGLLNPYLARLEQFLIAPGKDPLGAKLLKGDDLISPKARMIVERIRLHIFGGEVNGKPYGPFPGKVLIFSNQIVSAEEIMEVAPPELKRCGLLYKAADKTEHGSKFEKDPKIKWMVGVGKSMEEGLNFQFASRIIRTETVWNPGSLEQSNSRINRPELKAEETRAQIFYDTIVTNRTIDITKTARLISKVIAAAKFENVDSPAYEEIPEVPIISMNLDSIRTFNSWEYINDENPGLVEYAKALQIYEKVRDEDYEEYKRAYIEKHGSGPVKTPVEVAPTPPDAKLMKVVPYVPGMGLYGSADLGLVRLDEFLNITTDDDSDEESETDDEEEDEDAAASEAEQKAAELKGRWVHTEWGEGVIRHVTLKGKNVYVVLPNGYAVKMRKSQCFLITKATTSPKGIREKLLQSVGKLPVTGPVTEPAVHWKPSKKALQLQQQKEVIKEKKETEKRELQKKKDLSIELTIFVANGFLGIDYLLDEENQTAMRTLQAHGFRPTPPYYYSRVVNYKALDNQLKMWKNKGLKADPILEKHNVLQAFKEMYELLKTGQIKNHRETYRVTKAANVVNFYRLEHKASNSKEYFKPYPIIQDGQAYIALPANGQAGTRLAMQYKRQSFRWKKSDPTLSFFGTVPQIIKVIKDLLNAGVTISNIEELRKEIQRLKVMKVRAPDEDLL